MTYRELIELYKNGNLDDTRKKKIEEDIERQEAISEYLFDREEISGLGSMADGELELCDIPEETSKESEEFTKIIQASIRKTFIKAGVIVGAVVLAIVCFIIFALPQITDKFYYDPSEILGKSDTGIETNRMSLDLAVYSEMFLPGKYREKVVADGKGSGKYDIVVMQSTSWTDEFINVGGTINKGDLILYDANLLKGPTGNAFVPADDVVEDYYSGPGAAGEKEDAWDTLKELDDGDIYRAYITLDKVMNYNDFVAWTQKNEINPEWCAICEKDDNFEPEIEDAEYIAEELIGFIYSGSCRELYYDEEKYPLLTKLSVGETTSEEEDWIVSGENMKQHMISMLRFMADETKFCEMMEIDGSEADLNKLADNVEKHGLNIYGFTVVVQKDEILKISEMDSIGYIYTNAIK